MKSVFVDAAYWIALARWNDQLNRVAKDARSKLGEVRLIATDEILTEFLTGLSKGGPYLRAQAVKAVRDILSNPNVKVIPQSRKSFLDGLACYEQRRDKAFSLQDCISMNVMESEGLVEVLTSDHNFEQAGFAILMRSKASSQAWSRRQ